MRAPMNAKMLYPDVLSFRKLLPAVIRYFMLLTHLIVSLSASAQRIHFSDKSNEWKLAGIAFGDPGREVSFVFSAAYGADTLISGRTYQCLDYYKPANERLALREDTVGGKLYFRFITPIFQWVVTDTLEHVLFDYNLKVNDSITLAFGKNTFTQGVRSIDSIRLGVHSYRRWHMSGYDFVEALGTPYGPLFPAFPNIFEGGYQLRCFSNEGEQPSCSPAIPLPFAHMPVWTGVKMASYFDNDTSCLSQPVTVDIGNGIIEQLPPVPAPNPGGKNMRLWIPSGIQNAILSIIDPAGRRVIEWRTEGDSEIHIGEYLSIPGIYYYVLQDVTSGRRYKGKLIFQ
jgi:hypothetical protein